MKSWNSYFRFFENPKEKSITLIYPKSSSFHWISYRFVYSKKFMALNHIALSSSLVFDQTTSVCVSILVLIALSTFNRCCCCGKWLIFFIIYSKISRNYLEGIEHTASHRECVKEKASETSTQRNINFNQNTMWYYTLHNFFPLLCHYYVFYSFLAINVCL